MPLYLFLCGPKIEINILYRRRVLEGPDTDVRGRNPKYGEKTTDHIVIKNNKSYMYLSACNVNCYRNDRYLTHRQAFVC